MRCYGPKLVKDTPWPPREQPNIGFPKLLESAILGVINQETNQPIIDPDPIGLNLAANNMFEVFNRYSVNSYQVISDDTCLDLWCMRVSSCNHRSCNNDRMARQRVWRPTSGLSETSPCLGPI